ncbi:hypothetical protein C8J57DRAFT_1470456 [Mycena rebaudengoi]|nr:hypothetical protein C8J57DRAFT_1470456 [Mycena rebaudengoi]
MGFGTRARYSNTVARISLSSLSCASAFRSPNFVFRGRYSGFGGEEGEFERENFRARGGFDRRVGGRSGVAEDEGAAVDSKSVVASCLLRARALECLEARVEAGEGNVFAFESTRAGSWHIVDAAKDTDGALASVILASGERAAEEARHSGELLCGRRRAIAVRRVVNWRERGRAAHDEYEPPATCEFGLRGCAHGVPPHRLRSERVGGALALRAVRRGAAAAGAGKLRVFGVFTGKFALQGWLGVGRGELRDRRRILCFRRSSGDKVGESMDRVQRDAQAAIDASARVQHNKPQQRVASSLLVASKGSHVI